MLNGWSTATFKGVTIGGAAPRFAPAAAIVLENGFHFSAAIQKLGNGYHQFGERLTTRSVLMVLSRMLSIVPLSASPSAGTSRHLPALRNSVLALQECR
jgi:hypothetical protein